MCNNTDKSNCENCIADILKVILLLQQNVCQNDTCLQTCDKGYLGQCCSTFCNTRPISLYTCGTGGNPLEMPVSKEGSEIQKSCVFRLEKLNDCCATCRVLLPNPEAETGFPYLSTNSFFTINLKCVCIIRCLEDTYVDCV